MTHHPVDTTPISYVLEHLTSTGFPGLAHALEILVNEAMKLERSEYLQAGPFKRSEDSLGYANGFKTKRVKTRLGELKLAVSKTKELPEGTPPFYANSLERDLRSERALTLAVAEMYVRGVSTRKVTNVVSQMCGLEVTSQQVSRAAAPLDEELEAWRSRPIGEHPFVHPQCALREGAAWRTGALNGGAQRNRSQLKRAAVGPWGKHFTVGGGRALA